MRQSESIFLTLIRIVSAIGVFSEFFKIRDILLVNLFMKYPSSSSFTLSILRRVQLVPLNSISKRLYSSVIYMTLPSFFYMFYIR